jgi:arginine decarboxylase
MKEAWSIQIARKVYGLENYARSNLIDIDEEGYLVINIDGRKFRIKELMDNFKLDVAYIRILPALRKSMELVYEAYKTISELIGYSGGLQPVFPMKVNPHSMVIEAIFEYGEKYRWGFNTGSIGELKALLNYAEEYSPRVIIFDGVTTENVAQELLKLHRLGWRVFVDVESENDLETLSKYPEFEIGIRIKPIIKLHGKWSGSVGLGSKFGMTTNTLIKLSSEYKFLKERATLLHMHPGSQIYRLSDVRNFFSEIKQVYSELRNLGFYSIQLIDPGGGMAYPYLDARDGEEESPDYTIIDYFKELLGTLSSFTPNPLIVYEGGRFIVSSHRLVAARVVDVRSYSAVHMIHEQVTRVRDFNNIDEVRSFLEELEKTIHELRTEQLLDNGKRGFYEDLIAVLREDIPNKIVDLVKAGKVEPLRIIEDQKIKRLMTSPTKRFVLNMSIFADIPDAVLVDQYFQAVPAQRLNEQPHVLATLSDLTCDSMGEVKEFISNGRGVLETQPYFTLLDGKIILIPGHKLKLRGVPLHLPSRGEPYYVVFLDTGAYQDTLAMKHNLIYGAPEVVIRERNSDLIVELVRHEELYA